MKKSKKIRKSIAKIKPFIHKYNWEGINFPSEKDNWKKFAENNVTIALNVLCAKIYSAYVSKHDSNRKKQVILLMISNGEQRKAMSEGHEVKSEGRRLWHYLAVKKLPALLRGITSNHCSVFYCLNCFHFFRTKSKLESHKKVCEDKDFGNAIMPSEVSKILEFNQYQKSDKPSFIIFEDLECIVEKTDGCKNNPENSSTAKVSEHILSRFSIFTISSESTQ